MSAWHRYYRRAAQAAVLFAALTAQAIAQDQFIENIRVTTNQETAVILIEFACQMRFVADTATAGGALLEVRVAPFDACRQQGIGSGFERQTYRPIGAAAAHLVEVEFDSLGLGDSLVQLTFDRPVKYTVTQRPTLRAVEIAVDLTDSAESAAAPPGRAPLSVRVIEPRVTQDYMINLQSTREPIDPNVIDSVALTAGKLLYAVADGRVTKVYQDYPGSLAGNGVRLTTDDGTYFFYAHLSEIADGIEVGVPVRAGQVLGYVGNTGNAGTSHLHFEVHPKGGSAINPYPLVKAIDACDVTDPLPPV